MKDEHTLPLRELPVGYGLAVPANLIPFEKWDTRDLRDSLLGHLEFEIESIEDILGSTDGPVSGIYMALLMPVLVDAGVFVDTDGTFYTFDMQHDHDPDNYSAPKFDLRDDPEMQHLRELLQEHIESASKDQIVRYQRWADNVITR